MSGWTYVQKMGGWLLIRPNGDNDIFIDRWSMAEELVRAMVDGLNDGRPDAYRSYRIEKGIPE